MENGSLWDLLHDKSKKVKLDWDTRLRISIGSAQGLAYLHHDCNPRIIHRDVKSSNILLDESFEAHLADFGIAKTYASTYVLGTIGYTDPEYACTSRLTEQVRRLQLRYRPARATDREESHRQRVQSTSADPFESRRQHSDGRHGHRSGSHLH